MTTITEQIETQNLEPSTVQYLKDLHAAVETPPVPDINFEQTIPNYHREFNAAIVNNYKLNLLNHALAERVAALEVELANANNAP